MTEQDKWLNMLRFGNSQMIQIILLKLKPDQQSIMSQCLPEENMKESRQKTSALN